MKKAAIITYTNTINYGAIFQCQALCDTINEFEDFDAFSINYQPEKKHKKMGITYKVKFVIKDMFSAAVRRKASLYKKKYLRLTEPYSSEELSSLNDEYDVFFAGSDQIWQYNISNQDNNFFLSFVNDDSKKFSYSASFGGYVPEQHGTTEIYKNALSAFNRISLREKEDIQLVKDICGKDAVVTLDPTLLQDRFYWQKYAKMPKTKKPYIFLYQVYYSESLTQKALKIAGENNWDVISVDVYLAKPIKGVKRIFTAGPDEWLGYILGSQMVLTTSFHASAFAINMHKRFFCEVDYVVDLLGNTRNIHNNRIENLLEACSLQDRTIENYEKLCNTEPDWEKADATLDKLRKESRDFIALAKESVSGEDEKISLFVKKENCCGCSACCSVCPVNAISMQSDNEGFLYPVIDSSACIKCKKCLSVCAFKKKQEQKGFLNSN